MLFLSISIDCQLNIKRHTPEVKKKETRERINKKIKVKCVAGKLSQNLQAFFGSFQKTPLAVLLFISY